MYIFAKIMWVRQSATMHFKRRRKNKKKRHIIRYEFWLLKMNEKFTRQK